MSVMMYRKDGKTKLHGLMVDYCIVEIDEVPALLKEGWRATPALAYAEEKPKRKRRTKAEMREAKE